MLPPPFAMRQCVTNLTPTLPCIHVASLVSLLLIVSHMFEGMSLRKSFASRKSSSALSLSSSKYRFSLFENFLQKPRSLQEEEGEEDGDDKVFPDQFSEDRWSKMLPEIIGDIIKRIESSEEQWPVRRDVVACACVCRRWREVTRAIVRSTQQSRMITFPSSLKQPGPGDRPMQCLIKRDKKNSTFYLYLGQTPTSVKNGKFLLAAQRFRHGAHTEYIISLDANDVSQRNYSYMGKVSSNFLGKKFTIYDSQPPHNGAKPSSSRANYHFANKQIFPQGPLGSFEIGQVSYNFNVLRARGPRRMFCTLHYPSTAATNDKHQNCKTDDPSAPARWVFMKNKAPRWHEHLQCWCLNFHGRVTVASVKNFQLVVAADPMLPRARGDDDVVLLQFGKVGNNVFTMDYRDPLSAFQAFAVCLTSFGMNLTYK